jgi:hypothetical protein
VQAEAAGIGREPWETSAEFTLRVLDLVSADERAVAELSVLYREARFSDHDLDEAARTAAVNDGGTSRCWPETAMDLGRTPDNCHDRPIC